MIEIYDSASVCFSFDPTCSWGAFLHLLIIALSHVPSLFRVRFGSLNNRALKTKKKSGQGAAACVRKKPSQSHIGRHSSCKRQRDRGVTKCKRAMAHASKKLGFFTFLLIWQIHTTIAFKIKESLVFHAPLNAFLSPCSITEFSHHPQTLRKPP